MSGICPTGCGHEWWTVGDDSYDCRTLDAARTAAPSPEPATCVCGANPPTRPWTNGVTDPCRDGNGNFNHGHGYPAGILGPPAPVRAGLRERYEQYLRENPFLGDPAKHLAERAFAAALLSEPVQAGLDADDVWWALEHTNCDATDGEHHTRQFAEMLTERLNARLASKGDSDAG